MAGRRDPLNILAHPPDTAEGETHSSGGGYEISPWLGSGGSNASGGQPLL